MLSQSPPYKYSSCDCCRIENHLQLLLVAQAPAVDLLQAIRQEPRVARGGPRRVGRGRRSLHVRDIGRLLRARTPKRQRSRGQEELCLLEEEVGAEGGEE